MTPLTEQEVIELAKEQGAVIHSDMPYLTSHHPTTAINVWVYTKRLVTAITAKLQEKSQGEAFGYVMEPAFFDGIRRSMICQDKHSSYQIPVYLQPQDVKSALEKAAKICADDGLYQTEAKIRALINQPTEQSERIAE